MFASFFYADVQEDATWMSLTCVVEHFISDILSRSNGATMRFEPEVSWGANAGLKLAQQMLEPVTKQKLCKTEPKQWVSFCTFYRSFTETFKSEVQGEEQISFSLLFRPVDLCCLCCHRRDGWRESSSVCKRTLEFFFAHLCFVNYEIAWNWHERIDFCSPEPQVPFAPGRKDKASGAECPLWEGPTCKETAIAAVLRHFAVGLSVETLGQTKRIFQLDRMVDCQVRTWEVQTRQLPTCGWSLTVA